ncbi:unnamed protein product, partial [Symbiodinium necroappetens]
VQSLAPLRATCRQPASAGEEAFQLKLPAKRRHQIHKVDKMRSAEEWANLTKDKEDCKWHSPSKRSFILDTSSEWVLHTPTGSIFGLKEHRGHPLRHVARLRLLNPRGWYNKLSHRGWHRVRGPDARPCKL